MTLVTSRMTCGLHFVKTYGSKSIKTLKSLPKIRGDYLCRGVRRHALPDELSAHGGARVLLGERDRVNGLAHHPEDRMVTHVHSVVMRCGRQGRLECGTGLPTPYGQPQPKTHGGLFRRQGRCRPRMRLRKVDVGPVLSGMPQMRRASGADPVDHARDAARGSTATPIKAHLASRGGSHLGAKSGRPHATAGGMCTVCPRARWRDS